ncbi:MAG: hypothetical protein ACRD0U_09710 [Acidimicrobiales bacterium]
MTLVRCVPSRVFEFYAAAVTANIDLSGPGATDFTATVPTSSGCRPGNLGR